MLRLLSTGLLASALSLSYVAIHERHAYADDDDEEEEEGGGGGEGGGEGEGEGEGEEGEEEEEDKEQPAVTSGGLFTLKSYPVREISRPLTLTEGLTQMRLSLGTDISSKGAFASAGVSLEGAYGYKDNFTILGGFTSAYNFKQFGIYAGFEGALAYDLVDIRVAFNVHRNAIPAKLKDLADSNMDGVPDNLDGELKPGFGSFCNPPSAPGEQITDTHMMCTDPNGKVSLLPTGEYLAGGTRMSIELGFPFRYAIKPEIAIVALSTLMTIDFRAVPTDYVTVATTKDMAGMDVSQSVTRSNSLKPDLTPSVGIATNPVPPLSVVLLAQLRIPDFDVDAGGFQVPVTGRIEFSPNQKFDIGLEFTLLNVKPPEGQSPIDNRFLALFAQTRFGK